MVLLTNRKMLLIQFMTLSNQCFTANALQVPKVGPEKSTAPLVAGSGVGAVRVLGSLFRDVFGANPCAAMTLGSQYLTKNQETERLVRVIRGAKAKGAEPCRPSAGYRYDGLYITTGITRPALLRTRPLPPNLKCVAVYQQEALAGFGCSEVHQSAEQTKLGKVGCRPVQVFFFGVQGRI
jgi:hypothetical protein